MKEGLKCKCIGSHGKNWYLVFWKGDPEEYNPFKHLLLYKLHPEF